MGAKAFSFTGTANLALNIAHDQRPFRVGSKLNHNIQLNTLDILNGERLYTEWREAIFPASALSKENVIDPE